MPKHITYRFCYWLITSSFVLFSLNLQASELDVTKMHSSITPTPSTAPLTTPSIATPLTTNSLPTDQISPENKTETIDKISIKISPIFDVSNPAENTWIFRTVNRFHINTQESVIKKDLLFKEGDILDEKILDDSERILRTRRYFNAASVTTEKDSDNKNNVTVNVHDVWTLVPEISYSHSGDNSNYGIGVQDSNFLGTGKTVNFSHSSTVLRTGDSLSYKDPNTGFLDTALSIQYADNDDGKEKTVSLTKPFLALRTSWAGGISHENISQESTLYNAGIEADRFTRDKSNQTFFYGKKMNAASPESIHRVVLGYSNTENTFNAVGVAPNASVFVPDSRKFSYPWVEYQHIYDGYIEAYNIQQINRIEDINLGAKTRFRMGYTNSPFTAYDKDFIFEAEYTKGFSLPEQQLILLTLNSTGLYGDQKLYNNILKGELSYHWQDMKQGQLFVEVSAARGIRLFSDLPLELGGNSGIRGYPLRYQAGDRLALLTIEQRYFGKKEWFSLFHIGAAIFYDQGRVFGTSAIPQSQQGWLRDAGIGLRISGTRTGNREEGTHNVLHLDLAAPLDGSSDISKVQWVVKVKKSF